MKMAVAWSYNIFWLNGWPHIKVIQQHFLAGTHRNTQQDQDGSTVSIYNPEVNSNGK